VGVIHVIQEGVVHVLCASLHETMAYGRYNDLLEYSELLSDCDTQLFTY